MDARSPAVQVLDRQRAVRGIARRARSVATRCLREIGREGSALTVLLTDQAGIRSLNRRYLERDGATDVIAFPADATDEAGRPYLGDVAVSVEQALEQAPVYGNTVEEEVAVLVIHGILHLLGMDHETDAGEMRAREREIHGRLLRRRARARR